MKTSESWSLLHERDKSRNSKLAATQVAGAFVHCRQVGHLVFNDQHVSLRFTFQRLPFCPQLTSPQSCFILNPYSSGNSYSLLCFFLVKKKKFWSCPLVIGNIIEKKKSESVLKHSAQWDSIPKEKADSCVIWMTLSYLGKHNWGQGNSQAKTLGFWPHSSISAERRGFKAFLPTVRKGHKET